MLGDEVCRLLKFFAAQKAGFFVELDGPPG